jgi:hypothetical protein
LALPLSHLGRCQSGDASGGLLASLLPLVVRRPLAEIRRAAVHTNRDERAAPAWGMARSHRPICKFSDAVAHSVAATPGIRGETVATCRVGEAGDGPPAPAPELPLPPLEPPLDAEVLTPPPVVVLGVAPVSLQYAGSWLQI